MGRWFAEPGDQVQWHAPLVELLDDKGGVSVVSADATGILDIFVFEGARVVAGEVVGRLTKPD